MASNPHGSSTIQLAASGYDRLPMALGPAEQPSNRTTSSPPTGATSPSRREIVLISSRPLFNSPTPPSRHFHGMLSQRQQQLSVDDDLFLDGDTRPSYPFLTCLLLVLTVLMLINLESVIAPNERHPKDGPDSSNNASLAMTPTSSYRASSGDEGYSFLDPFRADAPNAAEESDPIADLLNQVFIARTDDNNDPDHSANQWSGGSNSVLAKYDSTTSFPTASFNLKGRYATFSLPVNQTVDDRDTLSSLGSQQSFSSFASGLTSGRLIDQGVLHTILLSRPSIIHSVRLATIRLDLESKWSDSSHGRKTISLAGLDLRDVSTLTFQGKVSPLVFDLPMDAVIPNLKNSNKTMMTTVNSQPMCHLFASLRFDRFPGTSRSARPVETQQNGGSGDWGFDLSDFGNGGEWERRRLLDLNNGQKDEINDHRQEDNKIVLDADAKATGGKTASMSNGTTNKADGHFNRSSDVDNRRNIQASMEGDDQDESVILNMLDDETVNGTSASSSSAIESKGNFQDLEGIIVSPNCGIRIVLSGMEIDLAALANKVIHFAFFFVLKGLLEVRFFISQVKYTDGGGSSPQKVCFISLGLHTCVDCFEAIILLTEAVTSSFMTSTFIILAIFKIMFVTIVELRYFVVVLRGRFSDTEQDNENLSRLVKLNAIGTAFILIWTLKLLPIIPTCITCLYLFWVPQIIYDAWKGNRLSLSPFYVVGMSLCRLVFPMYLWGCPASIFDGEIFKSPPAAPSATLCIVIVTVVAVQVVLIFIQRTFGPRAFVPESCLPEVYNYYRPIPKAKPDPEECRGYECVICMTDISYIGRTLVTTPCDHHFHDTCLQQWMDVKAECPTCRRPLPPFP